MQNLFMEAPATEHRTFKQVSGRSVIIPDYSQSRFEIADHAVNMMIGFVIGFAVLFIFYRVFVLAIIGGLIYGIINIFAAAKRAVDRRKLKLRTQFFDLLEAMSVSMRAGNPPLKALENSREDLLLIYTEDTDIIIELNIMIGRFNNAVPLSEIFLDLAKRSGLPDIMSFASIYATIEGKSSRADEIVRETQAIISDKMEIEMEIETMMTAAKNEANIMLVLPLVIIGAIGYVGAGFMDAIYTTMAGRIVASLGLVLFIISYLLSRKFSSIEL